MKILTVLFLGLFLFGCTITEQLAEKVEEKGAEAATQILDTSVWGTCCAATQGAVKRKYNITGPDREAYDAFCNSITCATNETK